MEKKGFVVFLAMIAAGLLAACIWISVRADKEPPVITVTAKERVYDGEDISTLLEGVTAADEKDGTVRATVESVKALGDGSLEVSYIAMDKSGNVGKASGMAKLQEGKVLSGEEDAVTEADQRGESKEETGEETSAPAQQPERAEPSENEAESGVNQEAPVLTLVQNEATIKAGETFRYMRYIDSIADDKDDEETLSKRIRTEGAENFYDAGTYEITFYVTDTDGNRSNAEVLTLTVE